MSREVYSKSKNAMSKDDYETWVRGDVSPTLNSFMSGGDTTSTVVVVENIKKVGIKAYRIGSYDSNSFKSSNPFSAINEVDVSNTLDNINCGYPGCNQGGMAIVEIRDSDEGIRNN